MTIFTVLCTTATMAQSGQALAFDGVDDYVDVTSLPAINAIPVTLEAFIKPEVRSDGSSFPNNVLSNDLPGNFGLGFGVNIYTSGASTVSMLTIEYKNGFRYLTNLAGLTAGVWTHIALVYNYGNVKTYINGVLVDDFNYTQQSLNANTTYMHIGKHNDDGSYSTRRFFKGAIDEVRVWNRALCSSEIAAQYTCQLNGVGNGLKANYNFNEGIAGSSNPGVTTAPDASPSAANGTLYNFTLSGTTSNWIAPGGTSSICTPYLIGDINIQGNGNTIFSGNTGISTTDFTNIGSAAVGSNVTKQYNLQNTGTGDLTATGITFGGANGSAFSYSGITFPVTLGAGTNTTFNITYTPTAITNQTSTIHIASNDCDEADYVFNLQGTGLCAPPIAYTVTGGTYCPNGTGAVITLSNSETGVTYQLRQGASNIGSALAGNTGSAITFPAQTTIASNYTVLATRTTGGCQTTMTGTASIALTPPPTITSITPATAMPGATVVLAGGTFDATAANNTVNFGAARAAVTLASSTSLSVTVPAGATYDQVSVTTGSCALTGYSGKSFDPAYCGSQTPGASGFTNQTSFATYERPFGVAIGDLNGDGKSDMVVADYFPNYFISVYKNTTTTGTINSSSFAAKQDFTAKQQPYYVLVQDMDGDGKPDVIVACQQNGGSVYPNTTTGSSITFGTRIDLPTGNYSVAIGDLDGDGRPDLAFAGPNIYLYRNTSTPGNISFVSTGSLAADASVVAITDLDNDGKPDIVGTIYGSNAIAVFRNGATPGNMTAAAFTAQTSIATQTNPYGMTVADLDGDGKTDLAVVCRAVGNIQLFRNASTGAGNFTWDAPVVLSGAYALVAGDVTGDGKPDLMYGGSTINTYINSATPGSLSAANFTIQFGVSSQNAYGNDFRQIALGDLDGDGKPDLASTNDGENTGGRPPGYVWVSRNILSPALPTITPSGPTTFCSGGSVQLTASAGFSSYSWSNAATTNAITSTATGSYTVTGTLANGCTVTSAVTSVTVNPLPQGSITANGAFCGSGNGQLTYVNDAGAGVGPYTIVYNDGTANRTANSVASGNPFDVFGNPLTGSKSYTLVSVTGANCSRSSAFTGSAAAITVNPVPVATAAPASQTICNGSTATTIALSSNTGNTSYAWARTNAGTTNGINANGSGDIGGTLTNTTSAPVTTTFTITPSTSTCTGAPITATITVDATLNAANTTVTPLYPMSGQSIQTVYLYPGSATSETIKVTPTGGNGNYSYNWQRSGCNGSAMTALSNGVTTDAVSSSAVFSPTSSEVCSGNSDNIYTYKITVSDNYGCAAPMITKRLNVVNPYKADGSVQICHKVAVRGGTVTQIMTVPQAQVAVHLGHGDGLSNCPTFFGKALPPDESVLDEQHITIYPNPTTGVFVLDMSEIREGATIIITDLAGRLITTTSIAKDAVPMARFDLSNYSRGIYLVQVRDGDLNYRSKIVVQ